MAPQPRPPRTCTGTRAHMYMHLTGYTGGSARVEFRLLRACVVPLFQDVPCGVTGLSGFVLLTHVMHANLNIWEFRMVDSRREMGRTGSAMHRPIAHLRGTALRALELG